MKFSILYLISELSSVGSMMFLWCSNYKVGLNGSLIFFFVTCMYLGVGRYCLILNCILVTSVFWIGQSLVLERSILRKLVGLFLCCTVCTMLLCAVIMLLKRYPFTVQSIFWHICWLQFKWLHFYRKLSYIYQIIILWRIRHFKTEGWTIKNGVYIIVFVVWRLTL